MRKYISMLPAMLAAASSEGLCPDLRSAPFIRDHPGLPEGSQNLS